MNELMLDNKIMPVVIQLSAINEHSFRGTVNNEFHTMYIVTEGSVTITEQNTAYRLEKGSVLFTVKDLTHVIKTRSNTFCINCYHFIMDTAAGASHEGRFIIPKTLHNTSGSLLYEKAELYMKMYYNSSRYNDTDVNSKFYDILAECVKFGVKHHPGQINLSDSIISYLHEHVNEQLNTKAMERHFYLTYKYMGTAFKKDTGYTILNYHTMLRMKSAAHMLTATTYSIDEISRSLGYSDALYFSRVFKKYHGIPPQAYRKTSIYTPR